MKKIVLFISCVLFFEFSNGQVPSFEWAKSMGGIGSDNGCSIVIDVNENVYTTGYFSGIADFDPGPGVFNLTSSGFNNIFISKLDVNGNFVWAKSIGGPINDQGFSVKVDKFYNVYITGHYEGTADFDPGSGMYNLTSAGGTDIFILKLDEFGSFVWAKSIGGIATDDGLSISVDEQGNVYSTGQFQYTTDFDPGPGTYNLTTTGSQNIFVLKLDTLGNFVWAKNIIGNSRGFSITIDSSGYVYTIGHFSGTADFDPGSGVYNLISDGDYDICISKLDAGGNFIWAKKLGGTLYDIGLSVAVDKIGNVYTTGYFQGSADFDPGPGVTSLTVSGIYSNIFISKLDSLGNFVWAKGVGDVFYYFGLSLGIDRFDNVYTIGTYSGSVDFNPSAGVFNLISNGGNDIFISKLDSSGNFIWATDIGGISYDHGYSAVVGVSGNIYATGFYRDTTDFDPNSGIFNLAASSGYDDIFVLKLSQTPTGINEATNSNNISIYPNPNNGTFNISISSQIQDESIEVYNSIGALVFQKKVTSLENTIELSNQANGLYFVKVMSENKIVGTGKIIKE